VFDLPSVSLRLFSPYGPGMGLTSAMGHFLKLRREGKPVTITGDGTQYRDMHYVDDCIEAFVLAAKSDLRDTVINIGSGQPVTINRLVEALGGPMTYIPARQEAQGTHADISLAKRLLGWEPKVSFEEGIRRTLA
jgi:UDP-glucose 4-epimerase